MESAVILLSTCLLALTSLPLLASSASATLQQRLTPTEGAYYGAAVPDTPGMTGPQEVQNFEKTVGRKLDLERVYKRFDDPLVDSAMTWDRDNNRDVLVSVNSVLSDGSPVRWADIAAGRYDATIRRQADAVKAFGAPLWLAFNHEPEDDTAAGGPADFVNAWRHYVDLFRAQGADNATWTWIMMAYSFRAGSGNRAPSFYPGDDYVDVVAADGYNWFDCDGRNTPWAPFRDIFADFHAFGVAHGKPEIVAEYGSAEDPAVPGRKAQWIRDVAATLQDWPEVKAVSYWGPSSCFNYKSSPSSLQALSDLGAQSYLRLRPQAAMTASVSEGASPLTVSFDGSASSSARGLDRWSFDPGDGSAAVSGTGTPPAALAHTYTAPGTSPADFTATLTVVDVNGRTDWQNVTVTADPAPVVTTGSADQSVTTADVSGRVDPNGLAATYYVQYGPTTGYGLRTAGASLPAGDRATPVSATLTGLAPVTTYHYRLVAVSAAGISYGDDRTVTTYGPPDATSWSVGDYAPGAATIRGAVDPNGIATRYRVEYGPTTAYGSATAWTDAGSNTWSSSVAVTLTGLADTRAYHYRIVATNAAGNGASDDKTFTSAGPGDATTWSVGDFAPGAATIRGSVDPNGLPTKYRVEYGPTTAYGSATAWTDAGSNSWANPVAVTLSGLADSAVYHYRIVTTNAAGSGASDDKTFTSAGAPAARTDGVGSLTASSAAVNGWVDSNQLATTYSFQYGTTTAYGATTASAATKVMWGASVPATALSGLRSKTLYHYRIVATNAAGRTYGLDRTFTTQ